MKDILGLIRSLPSHGRSVLPVCFVPHLTQAVRRVNPDYPGLPFMGVDCDLGRLRRTLMGLVEVGLIPVDVEVNPKEWGMVEDPSFQATVMARDAADRSPIGATVSLVCLFVAGGFLWQGFPSAMGLWTVLTGVAVATLGCLLLPVDRWLDDVRFRLWVRRLKAKGVLR